MKKIIIPFMMYFACLHFSFGQCDDTRMYDIYTPAGSLVNTWLMCEASIYEREYYDDYYSSTYPNAEMITVYDGLSSTRKFNCHGYAWLRVEQGIDRWIGYYSGADPDIYMADGSYVQVSQETFPGKVFWDRPYGDHTAITTEQQGWFISKWNEYPLFKHRWDDSPYGTAFKYYVKNCPPLVNFTNRIVTTNTTVTSCGDINIENVTVKNGAKLILNATERIILSNGVTVKSGATLEVYVATVTIDPEFTVEEGANFIIK